MLPELDEHPKPEDLHRLIDGVRSFSRHITGNEAPRTVAYFLRDDDGEIVGGVQGDLWGRSMHIAVLWVDERERGRGHGSTLMRLIEKYALDHNHPLVYLETTSFQALPFYQGLGYELFGELDGICQDEKLLFLKKEVKAKE